MTSIQDLPDEIILKIIYFLNIKDLVKFGRVSKKIDFESQILALFDSSPLIQNSISSPGYTYVDSQAKSFLILYPPLENSKTPPFTRRGGQVVQKCPLLSMFIPQKMSMKRGRWSRKAKIWSRQFVNGPLEQKRLQVI